MKHRTATDDERSALNRYKCENGLTPDLAVFSRFSIPTIAPRPMPSDPIPSPHFDSSGNPQMVDVSDKPATRRTAIAVGEVTMARETAERIRAGDTRKGDVLGVAKLAAIQASKLTQQLIPLCHAIPLEAVQVEFGWITEAGDRCTPERDREASDRHRERQELLRCRVKVQTTSKTGVEMEAMTAASIGCLTVYDMVKSLDRGMIVGPIILLEKSGGNSGTFRRET